MAASGLMGRSRSTSNWQNRQDVAEGVTPDLAELIAMGEGALDRMQSRRTIKHLTDFRMGVFKSSLQSNSRMTCMSESPVSVIDLSADVVASYVANNRVEASEIPALIASVHAALSAAATGHTEEFQQELKPAVSIKKSVTPDAIICLEDGKAFKSLKRHLRTAYGMSPDDYRAKWRLPADYPMVASNYAAQRSEFAKKIGLGRSAPASKGRRGRG
jgi:predicted transcriptional regulator